MAAKDETALEKLRQQRDRFIAFAFAGADLLLEVNMDGSVAFSAGAGESLYGLSDGSLVGKPLAQYIHPRDRSRFEDALQRLHNTGRLDHTPVAVMGAAGTITRMRMSGIKLPQFTNVFHLALSRIPPMVVSDLDRVSNDPKERFIDMVQQRLNEGNRVGEDYILTLFDLSPSNFQACDPAALQSYFSTFHHTLEQCSVRQASAGAISDRTFGLVHEQTVAAEDIRRQLVEVTSKFSRKLPNAEVRMHSATLEMDDSALSDEDITKALNYIIGNFTRSSGQFSIGSLAQGAQIAVQDTLTRVRNFRKMVKGDQLTFHFQPIVNLRTGAVLQYEAFARIKHQGGVFLPSQIVPFATDVGIIGELDLAACRKAMEMIKDPAVISPLAQVAINVSGVSLGNPGFYHALLAMLEQNKGLLPRMIMEVADADRIYNLDEARRLLGRIKRLGMRISLDDFGSGGAAFDLLRALPADFAKIDQSYVLDARDPKGRSVLRALSGLCQDLGLVTIAERVEDSSMLDTLRDLGIEYAQGHYFGKPAADAARKIRYYKDHIAPGGLAAAQAAVPSAG